MILVAESMHADGIDKLRQSGFDVEHDDTLWQRPDDLQERAASARALIVRNRTQVDADLLAQSPELRVLGRLGVGTDNLDLAAIQQRGIAYVDAKGANAASVAEYVLSGLTFLTRRLDSAIEHVEKGGWDRHRFGGHELMDRALGLVGLGDIGLRVAWRARAFQMEVWAHDPLRHPHEAAVQESGIYLTDLDSLLANSDVVSLHAPLTPQTHHLIDGDRLADMNDDAYLINTSRGELVDSEALAQALQSGRLGGALLDVVDEEPPSGEHPLRGRDNVWITPHVAGLTDEAQVRVSTQVADGVIDALRTAEAD